MTEDEAKTKWCPFARVVGEANASERPANRWPEDPMWADEKGAPTALCIASACMAWRWTVLPNSASPTSPAAGYCGLAGAVQ